MDRKCFLSIQVHSYHCKSLIIQFCDSHFVLLTYPMSKSEPTCLLAPRSSLFPERVQFTVSQEYLRRFTDETVLATRKLVRRSRLSHGFFGSSRNRNSFNSGVQRASGTTWIRSGTSRHEGGFRKSVGRIQRRKLMVL
jgi:hypothetical protein